MGYWNEKSLEYEERGYGTVEGYVCKNCTENTFLKIHIEKNGSKNKCSYCGKSRKCIELEDFLEHILRYVYLEYGKAINSMGWAEGEYHGATTWETYELFEELNEDMELEEKLLEDIIEYLGDDTWCETDPYGEKLDDAMKYSWQRFCKIVKHKARYVFFRIANEDDEYSLISAVDILDHISSYIERLDLIIKIPANTTFYRGRAHRKTEKYGSGKELGSPPVQNAKSNRMSAEGISIFYGANNHQTAQKEIEVKKGDKIITVAEFKNLKELHCLDLTKIKQIDYPSLFDEKNRPIREIISFYREFDKNITRPIDPKREIRNIEYVPAQIIAEYFRYIHQHKNLKIDGIKYSSAKNKDDSEGVCYALFFDNEQCSDDSKKETWENKCELKYVEKSAKKYTF